MKRILRKMTRLSYGSAKRLGISKLALQACLDRRRQPLLVYSMGKVGTTSIADSLSRMLPGTPIYHIHTLSEDRIRQEEEVYRKHFGQLGTIHDHLLNSLFLYKKAGSPRSNGTKWKVVTLVRDPIARNISAFFQMLNLHYASHGFADRIKAGGDAELVTDMIQFFLQEWDHNRALDWFDREIKKVFGIDVLAEDFPIDEGFNIYHSKSADILLIRLEDLDRCVKSAFDLFLGLKELHLAKGQVAGRKYYADFYREFQTRLILPPSVLEYLYGSRFVTRFYSPQEIEAFKAKWGQDRTN